MRSTILTVLATSVLVGCSAGPDPDEIVSVETANWTNEQYELYKKKYEDLHEEYKGALTFASKDAEETGENVTEWLDEWEKDDWVGYYETYCEDIDLRVMVMVKSHFDKAYTGESGLSRDDLERWFRRTYKAALQVQCHALAWGVFSGYTTGMGMVQSEGEDDSTAPAYD